MSEQKFNPCGRQVYPSVDSPMYWYCVKDRLCPQCIEIERLRGEITGMAFYGCLTGDCPHSHANDCLQAMFSHFAEIDTAAREATDDE